MHTNTGGGLFAGIKRSLTGGSFFVTDFTAEGLQGVEQPARRALLPSLALVAPGEGEDAAVGRGERRQVVAVRLAGRDAGQWHVRPRCQPFAFRQQRVVGAPTRKRPVGHAEDEEHVEIETDEIAELPHQHAPTERKLERSGPGSMPSSTVNRCRAASTVVKASDSSVGQRPRRTGPPR